MLERSRLIDEHDGNPIFDRKAKPVLLADEHLFVGPVFQRPLALGADEDVEEELRDGHDEEPGDWL
jgi:hypothetical protein